MIHYYASFWTVLILASNILAASNWGSLFADAAVAKDKEQIDFLIRTRISGGSLDDLLEAAKQARDIKGSINVELLERVFYKSLSSELTEQNFARYLSAFSNSENGTEFRMLLIKPMLKSQGRLSREQNETLFTALMSTLKGSLRIN